MLRWSGLRGKFPSFDSVRGVNERRYAGHECSTRMHLDVKYEAALLLPVKHGFQFSEWLLGFRLLPTSNTWLYMQDTNIQKELYLGMTITTMVA